MVFYLTVLNLLPKSTLIPVSWKSFSFINEFRVRFVVAILIAMIAGERGEGWKERPKSQILLDFKGRVSQRWERPNSQGQNEDMRVWIPGTCFKTVGGSLPMLSFRGVA